MGENEIGVYFSDPAYKQGGTEEQSSQFKRELEGEFGLPANYTSIGTGAAEGAYVVKFVLDNWPYGVLLLTFFQGEKINKNLNGWIEIGQKLSALLEKADIVDRAGSAVLAVNKLFETIGKLPASLRLVGYTRKSWFDRHVGKEDPGDLAQIDPPDPRPQQISIHVFQIEIDEKLFRVFVEEKEVWLKVLSSPSSPDGQP